MLTESANQTTAIRIEGEEPPTEFRLFAAGVNETLNGPYTFDAASAESVMRAAADWGVMTMIDLEHLSVDKSSPNYSPDALGWCRLEVRDGELWAVEVDWNDEGKSRIVGKRQRYISPTFAHTNGHVDEIINLALVAMPATKKTIALAARATQGATLDPQALIAIGTALGLSEGATLEEILAAIGDVTRKLTEALAGKASEQKPAEKPAEDPKMEELPAEKSVEMSARKMREENESLSRQVATLAAKLTAFESAARRELVGELVKLGFEIPATAWEDEAGQVPCERLRSESVESLKARVAKLSAARAPNQSAKPSSAESLTEAELKICKETGCDPKVFASLKASRS